MINFFSTLQSHLKATFSSEQKPPAQANTCQKKQESQEFTLLQNYSSEIVVIDFSQDNQPIRENANLIVNLDNYYLVVEQGKFQELLNESEWEQFCQKQFEGTDVGQEKLTLKELQTIIVMRFEETHKRVMYWKALTKYQENKTESYQSSAFVLEQQINLRDEGKSSFESMQCSLKAQEMKSFNKNMSKIQNKLKAYLSENQPDEFILTLKSKQFQICSWIRTTLIEYAAVDPQVGYVKGLEYLCLGIVFGCPQVDLVFYSHVFYYLMHKLNFRSIFLEGSPKFYQELLQFESEMKEGSPLIFGYLSRLDLKSVLISYYKTVLIYRVSNKSVICKLLEMMLIYGVSFIRKVLVKILLKMESQFKQKDMKDEHFLNQLAFQLVATYFHPNNLTSHQVNILMKQLLLNT